jgi:exoribonuclease-2
MLPEKLSNDLTSLNFNEDRPAIVIEMLIDKDGTVKNPAIYSAVVQNHAKLAYNSVSDWLDGNGARPLEIGNVAGLEENLRQQDRLALKLRTFRHINGSLDLETIETHPVFIENELSDLKIISKNRATGIIEDFMIASNGVTVRFLESRKFPTLSRVVSVPKRWDRIVEIADEQGFPLPAEPDSKALEQFLAAAKVSDPLRFPDLSLSIIKLLGQGEYAAQIPGASHEGHFGLAVKDYAHSTAPNRRFPDLITQRLLKAALAGQPVPYTNDELEELAKQCTRQEDNAKKVERRVEKSAAAILLEPRIGEDFDAIVTGAAEKGTWVRLIEIPVEGKLVSGFDGVDVGQKLKVRLAGTDVERGYIDFKKI